MEDRSEKLRSFFADLICTQTKVRDRRIRQAFAATRREPFVGPGPWSIFAGHAYIKTRDDDPAFIYQNTLVALDSERSINIGLPSAHAFWLDALALREGETVLQIGAGTGYYTAIIAHLVGAGGRVHAYEIDGGLAARASENLKDLPQVDVQSRSGVLDGLPKVDAIYVCAGISHPSRAWLDAPASRRAADVPAPARRWGWRHVAAQASRSWSNLAGKIRVSRTIHWLRGTTRGSSQRTLEGSVFAGLGSGAIFPNR